MQTEKLFQIWHKIPKLLLVQNLMGPLQKHLKPYSLNILVIIFEKLVEIRKNVKP